MNTQHPLLIMQESPGMLALTRIALIEIGLEQGKDFIEISSTEEVGEMVRPGIPQLLIIGSALSEPNKISKLAEKLRDKNSKLVIVACSHDIIPGDHFDRRIDKDMGPDWKTPLIAAIEDFREGILHR